MRRPTGSADSPRSPGPVVVVMGVSGAGKSTTGLALARAWGASFLDADDFHAAEAIGRMRAGTPLTDSDRLPWLARVGAAAAAAADRGPVVVACSALRRRYRDVLREEIGAATFVHLVGSPVAIRRRLLGRSGHFMHPGLLRDQLDTLEQLQPDEDGHTMLTGEEPLPAIVDRILGQLAT